MDSGFHVCGFQIPHPWILDSISGWIPDFGIWIPSAGLQIPQTKLPGLQIPDYLTWGNLWTINSEVVLSVISASKTINIDKILGKIVNSI